MTLVDLNFINSKDFENVIEHSKAYLREKIRDNNSTEFIPYDITTLIPRDLGIKSWEFEIKKGFTKIIEYKLKKGEVITLFGAFLPKNSKANTIEILKDSKNVDTYYTDTISGTCFTTSLCWFKYPDTLKIIVYSSKEGKEDLRLIGHIIREVEV